jgi:hypothetical protein
MSYGTEEPEATSCRRRSRPGDTLSRPCVRRVVGAIAVPLARALGSIDSAVNLSIFVRRPLSYCDWV